MKDNEDILNLLNNRMGQTNQKFANKIKKAEEKAQESAPILAEFLGVDTADGKGVFKTPDGGIRRGEVTYNSQVLPGDPVLAIGDASFGQVISMPSPYRYTYSRRRRSPQIIKGKIAILAELIYEADEALDCSCSSNIFFNITTERVTKFTQITIESTSKFIELTVEKRKLYSVLIIEQETKLLTLSVLYKITKDNDPVPCECQRSYDRRGAVVQERCDNNGRFNSSQNAANSQFPDPSQRYAQIYVHAPIGGFLGFQARHRISAFDRSFDRSTVGIISTHPAYESVREWAYSHVSLNAATYRRPNSTVDILEIQVPFFPKQWTWGWDEIIFSWSLDGLANFRLMDLSFMSYADDEVTSNGWLVVNGAIGAFRQLPDGGRENIPMPSSPTGNTGIFAFKMAYPGDTPSSSISTGVFADAPFVNYPVSWVKLFGEDEYFPGEGSPGDPIQEQQQEKKAIHFYLGGNRSPILIKKVNASEQVRANLTTIDKNSNAIALTIGNNEEWCKTYYTLISNDETNATMFANPNKPTDLSNWRSQYIHYTNSASNPATGNTLTDRFKDSNDINLQTTNQNPVASTETVFALKFGINQNVKFSDNSALPFITAFKGTNVFNGLICVSKYNASNNTFSIEKGVKCSDIIPCNDSMAEIISVSAFIDKQQIEALFNSSTESCEVKQIYQGTIIETWYIGEGDYVFNWGVRTFSKASDNNIVTQGRGLTTGQSLILYDCNDNQTVLQHHHSSSEFRVNDRFNPTPPIVIGFC